jgi:hypothetical protein
MSNTHYVPIYDMNQIPKYTKEAIGNVLTKLSYSKIATLFSCPKFFEMTYLCGLKSPIHPKTTKGTKLHSMYEKLNNAYDQDETLYKTLYSEYYGTMKLEALKYSTLWLPYKKLLAKKGYKTVCEQYLKVDFTSLFNFPCSLGGYLDFLGFDATETEALVIDYKSTDNIGPEYVDQAILYALLVFDNYPKVNQVETHIYDISENTSRTFIKPNGFIFKRENLNEIKKTLAKIVGIAKDLIKNENFYASPSKKCFSCPLIACKYNRLNKKMYDEDMKVTQEVREDTYLQDNNINMEKKPLLNEVIESK